MPGRTVYPFNNGSQTQDSPLARHARLPQHYGTVHPNTHIIIWGWLVSMLHKTLRRDRFGQQAAGWTDLVLAHQSVAWSLREQLTVFAHDSNNLCNLPYISITGCICIWDRSDISFGWENLLQMYRVTAAAFKYLCSTLAKFSITLLLKSTEKPLCL